VDFSQVQEQASWVCGCPSEPVARLEEELKARLEQEASLEGWAAWLEQVVDRTLAPLAATAAEPAAFTRGARQFLLRYIRQGVHDKDARPERLFIVIFFVH
jgi:regulatory factor X 1/2/3